MLRDSDTRFLMEQLKLHPEPWRWFTGDWPLGNHFYRPISTALFQIDLRLYRHDASGFGATNALLAIGCVLALFWFLAELTLDRLIATAATLLFASWLLSVDLSCPPVHTAILVASLIGSVWRHRHNLKAVLVPTLVVAFALEQIRPMAPLKHAVIEWLPGRTASCMTVFVLLSLGCVLRWVRLRSPSAESVPTSESLPATKSASVRHSRAPFADGLLPLAFLFGLAALGAYEQAVMLPFLVGIVILYYRSLGFRPSIRPVVACFVVVGAYLGVRYAVVPSAPSYYQVQQFKHSYSVVADLLAFLFPAANLLPFIVSEFSDGWILLLTMRPWSVAFSIASNFAAASQVRRFPHLTIASYALSFVSFAPMAWFKGFPHYYLLPLAFRSLFVVLLLRIAADCLLSGWSPRARQAPLRQSPAPGSLPRP